MAEIPDLSKTSLPELLQELHVTETSDNYAGWTLEQLIEHACSLALGYGASGRADLLAEYKEVKAQALILARGAE